MTRICINSLRPRTTDIFGKRALLAPHVLKSHIEAFDPAISVILHDFPADAPIENVVSANAMSKPNIIAFSTYVWNIDTMETASRELKKYLTTPIVFGGPGSGYQGAEILSDNGSVDVVVAGEGESALLRLCYAFSKRNSRSLSDIPNIYFREEGRIVETRHGHVEPLEEYSYHLDVTGWEGCARVCYETSRGCVMQCKFCLWHKEGGNRIRCYPMEKVKGDLDRLMNIESMRMVEFVDADLFMKPKRALAILEHFATLNNCREQRGLPRAYILLETNPELMNDEVIGELANHDRILDFGLQTIDETVSTKLGRPFQRSRYFGKVEKVVTLKSRRFSEHMVEVIYGLPGETLEGFRRTVAYVLDLDYLVYIWGFRLLMMPGTAVRVEAVEAGAVFNQSAPYELISSDSWTQDNLRRAEQLSRALFIIEYAVPEVFDSVKRLSPGKRLPAVDALTDFLLHPSTNNDWFSSRPAEEVHLFQRCCTVRDDPHFVELRMSLSKSCQSALAQAGFG
ncbi:MAG: cobalamin B12-binding domain-containing protein [Chloroflexi bacterium]|nr:cobalamin B12-binding domain-containing protein [Chloroflexota bacterium]